MPVRFKNNEKVELNMAPLIDCVFLLLVFFLVATMMKKEKRDIDIELPVSISALDVKPDDRSIVIGVTKDSEFFYNGIESSLNEIHEKIAEISETDPDTHIRFDADRETPFRAIVQILDLCSFRGLRNVGVRTYDEQYNR